MPGEVINERVYRIETLWSIRPITVIRIRARTPRWIRCRKISVLLS